MSLKPALQGHSLPEHYVFSMNLESDRAFDPISKGTLAIVDGEFKFVSTLSTGQQTLYRYRTDAREEINLIGSEPDVANRMHGALQSQLEKVNQAFAGKREPR
jgi:hypothetical protein